MSYKTFKAGSVFITNALGATYKVETGPAGGLTFLNRVFPVGTEISFDGHQGRIPLFPYHTIIKKWQHFFELHIPVQTMTSSFTIVKDLQLEFLVWNEDDPILSLFHPRVEMFALSTSGQSSIKNIDLPDGFVCEMKGASGSPLETVEYEAGLHYFTDGITIVSERGHAMMRDQTDMVNAGFEVANPVNFIQVQPLNANVVNFVFFARG